MNTAKGPHSLLFEGSQLAMQGTEVCWEGGFPNQRGFIIFRGWFCRHHQSSLVFNAGTSLGNGFMFESLKTTVFNISTAHHVLNTSSLEQIGKHGWNWGVQSKSKTMIVDCVKCQEAYHPKNTTIQRLYNMMMFGTVSFVLYCFACSDRHESWCSNPPQDTKLEPSIQTLQWFAKGNSRWWQTDKESINLWVSERYKLLYKLCLFTIVHPYFQSVQALT